MSIFEVVGKLVEKAFLEMKKTFNNKYITCYARHPTYLEFMYLCINFKLPISVHQLSMVGFFKANRYELTD